MKWSVIIAVVVVLGLAVGGGYYIIHQREIRVETISTPADAARAREDIGTYKDAKHPSFPGSQDKQ